jgi:hypothetical protein
MPPVQGVRLVLKSVSIHTECVRLFPPHHPTRALAKAFLRPEMALPASLRSLLRPFLASKHLYRLQLAATHVRSFEDLVSTLAGDIQIQYLPAPTELPAGIPPYPLQDHGADVIPFSWIAPWARRLLMMGGVQYLELDASFHAVRPYVYAIPFAVIANYGIPLGLIMTPTERQESYELFYEGARRVGVDSAVVDVLPLLSDEGLGLIAYARAHRLSHYFCFRHRLELLGSGTFVALLARRLFFCGTESEYRSLKLVTIIDFDVARTESAITPEGAQQFCRFFGLEIDRNGHCIELRDDPFVPQALWSSRGDRGVATCSNHCEGSHGRLNRKTSGKLSLLRRLAIVIDFINAKAEKFTPDAVNRSARQTLYGLQIWANDHPDKACRSPCPCGWDRIDAHRYQLANFPCRHTAANCEIDWSRVDLPVVLEREGPATVRSMLYTGAAWHLTKSRATAAVLPIAEPDAVFSTSPERLAFIERFSSEMRLAFPHLRFAHEDLHFRYGRFLCADEDTNEQRAKFQLLIFRECTQHRWK